VEAAPLTMLLVEALATAGRHGGSVVIEQIDGGWHTSITKEKRCIASAHDAYLESALQRLNARAAAHGRGTAA
jgi:hypothetical protein